MINLIAKAFLISVSSYLFVKKFFRTRFFGDLFLIWFILLFSQIVLIELFLGVIGRLYSVNILFAHLVIFLMASFFFRPTQGFIITKPGIEVFLNDKLLLLAFSVFICFFSAKTFINLINPPICADSLQYHLTFPATWIRSGQLDNPFCVFGGVPALGRKSLEMSATSYYPINAQLFFTWLMAPLRNAFLADIGEVPFYIVGIISVNAILKKYGIKRRIAIIAGFLWVLIPNIFKQLKYASQIDVICAVLFLLVFYAILSLKEEFNFRNSALFSIASGLFLGTKVINIVWFSALTPFFLYIFYRESRRLRFSPIKILSLSAMILFVTVLFGGFMYIKNFIFTGNPFFPVDLKIFGRTIFKGLVNNATYKNLIASGDRFNLARIFFKEGLGVQFLGLILPGIFLPVIFYRYIRAKAKPFGEYLLLFMTPVTMLILYRFFINVYVMRYLFPYLSMGLITAVIFINLLPHGERYFNLISFISILASVPELAHRQELIISVALSLLLFTILFLFKKQIITFYKSRIFNKALVVFLILGILFLGYLNDKYNKEEFKRYPSIFSKKESWQIDIGQGWQKLNELTKEGSRVAYTGRQEFYPLFGYKLKNGVKYVSVNEKEISPYNKPDGMYRRYKDFGAWRENLRKEEIGYLFIALPFSDNRETEDPTKFPVEDEWATAHPEDFRLLFGNSLCRIYRVLISDKDGVS